jgi:hypothetical protein
MVPICCGVNDKQVMAAVEEYGAQEDTAFKAILERIARSLSGAIGLGESRPDAHPHRGREGGPGD